MQSGRSACIEAIKLESIIISEIFIFQKILEENELFLKQKSGYIPP